VLPILKTQYQNVPGEVQENNRNKLIMETKHADDHVHKYQILKQRSLLIIEMLDNPYHIYSSTSEINFGN
jgi:hypothetical protein